jgi:hypothetical protein
MNRGFLTTWLLLILSAIAVGIIVPREGLSMSHSGSTGSCGRLTKSFKGSLSLIEYFGWLRSASGKEKAKQNNCADSVGKNGKPRGKLVLALTLIMPDTPFADFARAKTLLSEYLRDADKEKPEDRGLAVLMLTLLDEIARLKEQLDQLKAIEKDITETEQSVNVPTPAAEPAPVPNDELEEEDTGGR